MSVVPTSSVFILYHFLSRHHVMILNHAVWNVISLCHCLFWVSISVKYRDSVVGVVTRYELDDPGIDGQLRARFSLPVQSGPGTHPDFCTTDTGLFPGVRLAVRGYNHPPSSRAGVKERVELYLYFPLWVFMTCSWVNFTFISVNCAKTPLASCI